MHRPCVLYIANSHRPVNSRLRQLEKSTWPGRTYITVTLLPTLPDNIPVVYNVYEWWMLYCLAGSNSVQTRTLAKRIGCSTANIGNVTGGDVRASTSTCPNRLSSSQQLQSPTVTGFFRTCSSDWLNHVARLLMYAHHSVTWMKSSIAFLVVYHCSLSYRLQSQ